MEFLLAAKTLDAFAFLARIRRDLAPAREQSRSFLLLCENLGGAATPPYDEGCIKMRPL